MPLKAHDVVRLRRELPAEHLPVGAVGAVVVVFSSPVAYEVEFCDEHGATLALVTVAEEDLEAI